MSMSPVVREEIGIQERRKYPRIKAAVRIEFVPEGAVSVTHATTADISCGGCYIEIDFTLPVGTKLGATLWLGEEQLTTGAVVTSHHSRFGNGVRFVDMSVRDLNRLNRFLQSALR